MVKKTTLNYIIFAFLFIGAGLLIGRAAVEPATTDADATADSTPPSAAILIDAGHGGEDGGAVSIDGTILEKNLNLDISLCCSDLCAILGIPTRMTRSDDTLLYDYYDDLDDYTGRRKSYDLRNRLRIAEETNAALFLGIHLNKFLDVSCKGLPVYYSPNDPRGESAASLIQSYAKEFIDPSNNREIKRATKAIYILNRITTPAVLVECGFISNQAELSLLSSPEYRRSLAVVIISSAAEFISAV